MGLYASASEGFYGWLQAHYPAYGPTDFVPRYLYGAYLAQMRADILATAGQKNITVLHIVQKVTNLIPAPQGWRIVTDQETSEIVYDIAVLACGNDRHRQPHLDPDVQACMGWWPHPYIAVRASHVKEAAHIVIIGSGLSMIDALVTLTRYDYQGRITVISPHSAVPFPHQQMSVPFVWSVANVTAITGPAALIRAIRRQAADGHDWRDVLDGLRPYANDLWRRWTPQMREQAKRYMYLWNTHRHRIPDNMHALFTRLKAEGQLCVLPTRAECITVGGPGLQVHTNLGVVAADIVINCMGYDYCLSPTMSGLMGQLSCSGLIPLANQLPHPDNQEEFCLNVSPLLYALGPFWQGYLIESTAVRDIRLQAEQIASHLLMVDL